MELLERGAFLDSLTSYADEAPLGQGRVVLVAGEAGVGKTGTGRTRRPSTWCATSPGG